MFVDGWSIIIRSVNEIFNRGEVQVLRPRLQAHLKQVRCLLYYLRDHAIILYCGLISVKQHTKKEKRDVIISSKLSKGVGQLTYAVSVPSPLCFYLPRKAYHHHGPGPLAFRPYSIRHLTFGLLSTNLSLILQLRLVSMDA